MNQSADQLRKEAAEAEQRAFDSFERSDTDGFLSQWASGITAQLKRAQAEIEENGGVADFPALLDLEGNEVPTRVIPGQYGTVFALVDDAGKFTGQFVPLSFTARSKHWNNYRPGNITAPAWARTAAPRGARGLSGATSVYVEIYRKYGGAE